MALNLFYTTKGGWVTQKGQVYKCEVCGMGIGSMTCATCGKELVNDTITTDDGTKIQVSKCPDDHGMVKSPMCCGQDMTYQA